MTDIYDFAKAGKKSTERALKSAKFAIDPDKAAQGKVNKTVQSLIDSDKKSNDFDRYLRAEKGGYRDHLRARFIQNPLEERYAQEAFNDYLGSYAEGQKIPYMGAASLEEIAKFIGEGAAEKAKAEGKAVDSFSPENKDKLPARLTYDNNNAYFRALDPLRVEEAKLESEKQARDLGSFKLSPLATRAQDDAVYFGGVEKLRDINKPEDYGYLDATRDKMASLNIHGSLTNMIEDTITGQDDAARNNPADPEFDWANHETEYKKWTEDIGVVGFTDRLTDAKSFAEAQAVYDRAVEERARTRRASEYFGDSLGGQAAEMATDFAIGTLADIPAFAAGVGVGAPFALGARAVAGGQGFKSWLARAAVESLGGGLEGMAYQHMYAQNSDPLRQETDLQKGLLYGTALGFGFEAGAGAIGKTRKVVKERKARLERAAQEAQDLKSFTERVKKIQDGIDDPTPEGDDTPTIQPIPEDQQKAFDDLQDQQDDQLRQAREQARRQKERDAEIEGAVEDYENIAVTEDEKLAVREAYEAGLVQGHVDLDDAGNLRSFRVNFDEARAIIRLHKDLGPVVDAKGKRHVGIKALEAISRSARRRDAPTVMDLVAGTKVDVGNIAGVLNLNEATVLRIIDAYGMGGFENTRFPDTPDGVIVDDIEFSGPEALFMELVIAAQKGRPDGVLHSTGSMVEALEMYGFTPDSLLEMLDAGFLKEYTPKGILEFVSTYDIDGLIPGDTPVKRETPLATRFGDADGGFSTIAETHKMSSELVKDLMHLATNRGIDEFVQTKIDELQIADDIKEELILLQQISLDDPASFAYVSRVIEYLFDDPENRSLADAMSEADSFFADRKARGLVESLIPNILDDAGYLPLVFDQFEREGIMDEMERMFPNNIQLQMMRSAGVTPSQRYAAFYSFLEEFAYRLDESGAKGDRELADKIKNIGRNLKTQNELLQQQIIQARGSGDVQPPALVRIAKGESLTLDDHRWLSENFPGYGHQVLKDVIRRAILGDNLGGWVSGAPRIAKPNKRTMKLLRKYVDQRLMNPKFSGQVRKAVREFTRITSRLKKLQRARFFFDQLIELEQKIQIGQEDPRFESTLPIMQEQLQLLERRRQTVLADLGIPNDRALNDEILMLEGFVEQARLKLYHQYTNKKLRDRRARMGQTAGFLDMEMLAGPVTWLMRQMKQKINNLSGGSLAKAMKQLGAFNKEAKEQALVKALDKVIDQLRDPHAAIEDVRGLARKMGIPTYIPEKTIVAALERVFNDEIPGYKPPGSKSTIDDALNPLGQTMSIKPDLARTIIKNFNRFIENAGNLVGAELIDIDAIQTQDDIDEAINKILENLMTFEPIVLRSDIERRTASKGSVGRNWRKKWGGDVWVAGALTEALKLDGRNPLRRDIYTMYAQIKALTQSPLGPDNLDNELWSRFHGRLKNLDLRTISQIVGDMSDVDFHFSRRNQVQQLFPFTDDSLGSKNGYNLGMIWKLFNEQGDLFEFLKTRSIDIDDFDPETIRELRLLLFDLEKRAKSDTERHVLLGPPGPTGLPMAIENILLPSSEKTQWKNFLTQISELVGAYTDKFPEARYRQLTREIERLEFSLDNLRKKDDITNPLRKGQIEAVEQTIRDRKDERAKVKTTYWGSEVKERVRKVKEIMDNLPRYFDDSIRDWAEQIGLEKDEQFIRPVEKFVDEFSQIIQKELIDGFEDDAVAINAKKMLNQLDLMLLREERYPEHSVDINKYIVASRLLTREGIPFIGGDIGFAKGAVNYGALPISMLQSIAETMSDIVFRDGHSPELKEQAAQQLLYLRMILGTHTSADELPAIKIFKEDKMTAQELRKGVLGSLDLDDPNSKASQMLADIERIENAWLDGEMEVPEILTWIMSAMKRDLTNTEKFIQGLKFNGWGLPPEMRASLKLHLDSEDGAKLTFLKGDEVVDETIEKAMPKFELLEGGAEPPTPPKPPTPPRRPGPGGGKAGFAAVDLLLGLPFKGTAMLGKGTLKLLSKILNVISPFKKRMTIGGLSTGVGEGDKVSLGQWLKSAGDNIQDQYRTGWWRRQLNNLRSRRARSGANESGLIRLLGAMAYGSDMAVVDGKNISYAGYHPVKGGKVGNQRKSTIFGQQLLQQGIDKARIRLKAKVKRELELFKSRFKYLAKRLPFTTDKEAALTGIINMLYEEAYKARQQEIELRAQDEADVSIVPLNLHAGAEQMRSTFEAVGMDEGLVNDIIKLAEDMEEAKQAQLRMLQHDEELRSALDFETGQRLISNDTLRDILLMTEDGVMEDYFIDALLFDDGIEVDPLSQRGVGMAIFNAIMDGQIHAVNELGKMNRSELRRFLDKYLDYPRYLQRFPDEAPELKAQAIRKIVDDLIPPQPYDPVATRKQIKEVLVDEIVMSQRSKLMEEGYLYKRDGYELFIEPEYFRVFAQDDPKFYTSRENTIAAVENFVDVEMGDGQIEYTDPATGFAIEGYSLESDELRDWFENHNETLQQINHRNRVKISLDPEFSKDIPLRQDSEKTYSYDRLASSPTEIGDKLNGGQLQDIELGDLNQFNILDDFDHITGRAIDKRVERAVIDEFNKIFVINKVVDEDGKILEVETLSELFSMFRDQLDRMVQLGEIENPKEFARMLDMLEEDITGRTSSRRDKETNRFIRLMQKGASAVSTLGFAVSTYAELAVMILRNFKNIIKHIPLIPDLMVNAFRSGKFDDIKADFMRAAGVGTEGALYRNTGSNRKSMIFDGNNPVASSASRSLDIGVKPMTERFRKRMERMGIVREGRGVFDTMTERFAEGKILPVNPLEKLKRDPNGGFLNQAANYLMDPAIPAMETVTQWGQRLVANSMINRVFDRVYSVNIPDNIAGMSAAEIQKLADQILPPVLRAQLGFEDVSFLKMCRDIKNGFNEVKPKNRLGVRHYDIGGILSTIGHRNREYFAQAIYNWVGQNIVRPDAGDLPKYLDNSFLQLIGQFRAFGMAQLSKQMLPMAQRAAHGEGGSGLALIVTTLSSSLYAMFNYYLYNPETVEEDMRRYGGLDGVMEQAATEVEQILSGEGRQRLKSPLAKIFLNGLAEPYMGPIGFGQDIATPFLGLPDPSDWYDDGSYGGKSEAAISLARSSAAYRYMTDTVDPVKRAFQGKKMDEDYAIEYAARMLGYNKFFKMLKHVTD